MGLLDSVVGALGQPQGTEVRGQPDIVGAVVTMLSQHGGLSGLVDKFHQGGLGNVVNSWIGTGQNLPVSPSQLGSVLGNDTVAGLAHQLGIDPNTALGHLSELLPQVVDKLTPHGEVPAGAGTGGIGDLAGMLSGLFKR